MCVCVCVCEREREREREREEILCRACVGDARVRKVNVVSFSGDFLSLFYLFNVVAWVRCMPAETSLLLLKQ